MQISHNYTHITSLLRLPPLPATYPSRSSQSARLGCLCYIATSHQLSLLYVIVYIYVNATFSIHLTLSFPHCVHKSILYTGVSISSLQIGSSIPFFWIPYVHVNRWYLFFSFWLTSLCIIGSRFIPLTRTDSNSFFLWLSNIPLNIYTKSSFHLLLDI